jgi:Zn-finger protein
MYPLEACPGNPTYMAYHGKQIKDCTNCTFPHQPENYDKIIEALKE